MPETQWYLAFAWGRAPYALDLPEVVIGRGDHCTLQIEEPNAAEEHARFEVDDANHVFLDDLGSGQPTLVNGKPISGRTALRDGDFIQIGASVLTLRGQATADDRDAKTVVGAQMPDEVKRVISQRAKNFVVGDDAAPQPFATLMMESPLQPKAREAQRTIEASADELLAQIRRNTDQPAQTVQMSAVVPSDALAAPDVAPRENATTQMQATSAPVTQPLAAVQPPRSRTLAGVGPANPNERTTPPEMPAPFLGTAPVAPEPSDLAAQPTMVATMPSNRDLPAPRRQSQVDITPLPAPLPPGTSIPDLGPYVASATGGAPAPDAAPVSSVGSASTISLRATDVALHEAKTQLPTEPPLHTAKTQLPTEPPLHQAKTRAPTPAPQPTTKAAAASEEPMVETRGAARKLAPPTERVAPIDAKARVSSARPPDQFVPPEKGRFGAFSRALDFFSQMFQLTKSQPALLKPLYYDLGIATALSIALSALMFVLPGRLVSLVMVLGLAGLYFVDYFCNALTASLLHDYANTGALDLPLAKARVKKALPGIATFAAVSGILDFATTYARERNDVLAKIVLGIIRSIWTTATYWILPALVLEGIPFKDAFGRSKKLMERDPTGVGAGIVALSLTSYLVGALTIGIATFVEGLAAHLHPALGVLLFFLLVNAYWAISGWIKISYSTCFYIWAKRCESAGRPDTELAPNPLRHAIAAG